MSLFDTIENFPWTHENEQGDIVKTQASDYYTFICARQELENIFNDNAQVRL